MIDESSGFGMLARGGDGDDICAAEIGALLPERVFCGRGDKPKLYIESGGKSSKLVELLVLQTRFAEVRRSR